MSTVDPRVAPDEVRAFLDRMRPLIDAQIDEELRRCTDTGANSDDPGSLYEAMRYAVLGPGKRLRPVLTVAACLAVGGAESDALVAAAAVELLHAYTLVHDDLPAMDDDDIRRGRPTVHVVFGEAIAVLVGDALLTAAFGALAQLGPRAGDAVAVLARRAGAAELIRGQAMDLAMVDQPKRATFAELEAIHRAKTGALFAAAAEIGGIAGQATGDARRALARYGMDIGVAFQYADDRDDREHLQHAAQARERMRELTRDAADIARGFAESGRILLAFATWLGAVA